MKRYERSWSGMRRYLEEEMLADSLKGRIRYNCTTYKGMDGGGIFEIFVDNKSVKKFSMETVAKDLYNGGKPVDRYKFFDNYWREKSDTSLENRREFDDCEFACALRKYRSVDIISALNDNDPIVRMFAVMDRRIGKRTLMKLKNSIDEQPEWLGLFYKLRLDAEKIA